MDFSCSEDALDASLDLLRRLNPKEISKNLSNICRLQPDLAEELLSSVDTPLNIQKCEATGKSYLCCDYNRDGDSYRSPWSNKYYPEIDDEDQAPHPTSYLRELELFANDSFDIYRDLYYAGGVSSVYLWDTEEEDVDKSGKVGFDGVVLLKKKIEPSSLGNAGFWDSIHVFEVQPRGNGSATYKITSTVILDLTSSADIDMYLSGNLTRQTVKERNYTDASSHVANIGSITEDIESNLRNMLQEVYFGKTKDIVGDLRSIEKLNVKEDQRLRQQELIKGFEKI
ncbi:DEKNAAC102737 [Brettanomyces naardenensis]|uniref:F-actin-capping protein subunit beta n=1 Tax=Brettanomyces naardenensis TaxID=13370 RepID=A0A448YKD7_BRENA|nr:DEKNAAC102737 [Brettanomyces naardenensis]